MTEQLRESLSALMDDEANELELERVLGQIGDDHELRQTWIRYHCVRNVTAGQALGTLSFDISQPLREAVAQELTHRPRSRSRMQHLLRPVAGLAVAASVAATVVIGGQQLYQLGGADTVGADSFASSPSPVGLVNSLGATSVKASWGSQGVPVLQPATRTAYRELARQRMNQFSQEHAEHAALNTPQGLIPFARVPQIQE